MKKRLLGIIILILLICGVVFIKSILNPSEISKQNSSSLSIEERKKVKIADLSDVEIFLEDKVKEIINLKYNFDVSYEKLSNNELSNSSLLNNVNSNYDLIFSNNEILNNLKEKVNEKNENNLNYENLLSTPLVIYSWNEVVDILINENIVTKKDDVYYITDMNKLINYILEGKMWTELGLDMVYGNINIISANPINTSSGASYYSLLLSTMSKESLNAEETFPKLKEIYEKSECMSSDEENLFDRYVRLGMPAVPLFADYEKSIIKFANSNPSAFKQIESNIKILYPSPTILKEYVLESFTENGNNFKDIFSDSEFQKVVLEKFGLRKNSEKNENLEINGTSKDMPEAFQTLDSNIYKELISYLNENN